MFTRNIVVFRQKWLCFNLTFIKKFTLSVYLLKKWHILKLINIQMVNLSQWNFHILYNVLIANLVLFCLTICICLMETSQDKIYTLQLWINVFFLNFPSVLIRNVFISKNQSRKLLSVKEQKIQYSEI